MSIPPIFNILRLHIDKTNSKTFWDEHQISIWDEHLRRTYEFTYIRTYVSTEKPLMEVGAPPNKHKMPKKHMKSKDINRRKLGVPINGSQNRFMILLL